MGANLAIYITVIGFAHLLAGFWLLVSLARVFPATALKVQRGFAALSSKLCGCCQRQTAAPNEGLPGRQHSLQPAPVPGSTGAADLQPVPENADNGAFAQPGRHGHMPKQPHPLAASNPSNKAALGPHARHPPQQPLVLAWCDVECSYPAPATSQPGGTARKNTASGTVVAVPGKISSTGAPLPAAPGVVSSSSSSESEGFGDMLRRVTTVTTSVFTSAGRKYTVSGAVMGLKGDRRLVLQGAHGRVHMGDMVAVMGGSGSGKSTLLEILAGRKTVGRLAGSVGLISSTAPAPPSTFQDKPTTTTITRAAAAAEPAGAVTDMAPSGAGEMREDGTTSAVQGVLTSSSSRTVPPLVWRSVTGHRKAVLKASAFVPQEDVLPPSLTAGELLRVTASLMWRGGKVPVPSEGQDEVEATGKGTAPITNTKAVHGSRYLLGPEGIEAVRAVLAAMGLGGAEDTLVGGPLPGGLSLRGLSGGERKRLSVAAGLVRRPRLLLLDEPTTGLDSAAALRLVQTLRDVCQGASASKAGSGGGIFGSSQERCTVLASVHQPRAAVWEAFDMVMLLSGGYTVYSGPREGLMTWFTGPPPRGLNFFYDPDTQGAAADWMLDLVNTGFPKPERFFGRTMRTEADLIYAASAFCQHHPPPCPPHEALHDGGAAFKSGSDVSKLVSSARAAMYKGGTTGGTDPFSTIPEDVPDRPSGTSGTSTPPAGHTVAASQVVLGSGEVAGVTITEGDLEGAGAGSTSAGTTPPNSWRSWLGGPFNWRKRQAEFSIPETSFGSGESNGGGEASKQMSVDSTPGIAGGSKYDGGASASRTTAGWFRQVAVLTLREFDVAARNPTDAAGRLLMFCWSGLVVGAVFYNLPEDPSGLLSRCNVVYVEVCVLVLLPYVYMALYISDKQQCRADASGRLYRPSAYYVAKSIALLPLTALNGLVFALVAYGMVGLPVQPQPMVGNIIICVLVYLTASQIMFLASLLAPNQDIAFMIGIAWTAINILVGNYPLRLTEYTMSWIWPLKYISAMYHAFSGLMAAEFGVGNTYYSCAGGFGDAVDVLPSFLPNINLIGFAVSSLKDPGPDCRLPTSTVLEFFHVTWHWWEHALALLIYLVVVHGLCLITMVLTAGKERR